MATVSKDTAFIVSKHGSPLSQLTSGTGPGKIKYIHGGAIKSAGDVAVAKAGPTGIVFPLHGDQVGDLWGNSNINIIGDPAEANYSLSSGDLFSDGVGANGNAEKNGGAQKFVNAVLDGAYRAYQSGVDQTSGLSSMTITRGDLSLSNTSVNDGTGIVNTYSRSYSVNFKYFQSGTINMSGNLDPAKPDIADDNSDGAPF